MLVSVYIQLATAVTYRDGPRLTGVFVHPIGQKKRIDGRDTHQNTHKKGI